MKKLWGVLLALCWGVAAATAQNTVALNMHVLAVDDSAYPEINVYLSVLDRERLSPVTGLSAADFFVETDQGETLTVQSLGNQRRPLHVVVLVDATGSVSAIELGNQVLAVQALTRKLGADDQLGIVLTDHEIAETAVPLRSDPSAALDFLFALLPREDVTGNVYWDAVHVGLDMLENSGAEARKALVILTDISPRGGEGERTEQDAITRAIENNIGVYGLYFEYEGDGIPENPPVLPPELAIIAEATGGVAFAAAAELRPNTNPQDYTDDDALPVMMLAASELLLNEYQLTLQSPLPLDGREQGLNLSLAVGGDRLPPIRTTFTAGQSPLKIAFPTLTNRQEITLPLTVAVDTQTSGVTITAVQAFAINEAGVRAPLGAVDGGSLSLAAGSLPPGLFRLLIEAQDSAGNSAEADIFLTVVETLGVSLDALPPRLQPGESLRVTARVSLASAVQNASLSVDGEMVTLQTSPPFDTLTFDWQAPQKGGSYTLNVTVQDQSGGSASSSAVIEVQAPAAAGGGLGTALLVGVVFALVGGSIAALGMFFLARRDATPEEPPKQTAPLTLSVAEEEDPPPALPKEEAPPLIAAESPPPIYPPAETLPPALTLSKGGKAVALLQGAAGERWMLTAGENTIGRHSANTIQLKDDAVSRYHAKIEVSGKRCLFSDWQASHPSEINGVLLEAGKRYELKNGDRIRLGSSLLRFEWV